LLLAVMMKAAMPMKSGRDQQEAECSGGGGEISMAAGANIHAANALSLQTRVTPCGLFD
jgi:hypothetical protein